MQPCSGFNPDGLRGPWFDGVVIDECSLQHEQLWQAVRPTLSDYGGWGLLLGSVPDDVASHWHVALHRYAASDAGSPRVSPWRWVSTDYNRGAFPEAVATAILPWLLATAVWLVRRPTALGVVGLASCLAAVVLMHTLSALIQLPLFLAWIGMLMVRLAAHL